MEIIKQIVMYLTYFAVIFTIAEFYFKINKIWKRRTDPEVAASQSLIALFIGAGTSLIWMLNFVLSNDWSGMAEYSIFLIESLILIIIGTGFFIHSNRKIGFFSLIKKALMVDKLEANYLINKYLLHTHKDIILKILYNIALIDEEYSESEKRMIDIFAKEWDIDLDLIHDDYMAKNNDKYLHIKDLIKEYITTQPNIDQAKQLKDLIIKIINSDNNIALEEQRLLDEIIPELEKYIDPEKVCSVFCVVVVPQENLKLEDLLHEFPKAKSVTYLGGHAYEMEQFYSQKFAELFCENIRKKDIFTTIIEQKNE